MPPTIVRQTPKQSTIQPPLNGSASGVLGTMLDLKNVKPSKLTVCLYGRNRIGKSTLACQFQKPLLVVATEPTETGGVDSITRIEGVQAVIVAFKPTIDPRTGKPEQVYGKAKLLTLAEELQFITEQTGVCPFKTVVVDTVTSIQDIVLTELMGLSDIPTSMGWGMISEDQYKERSSITREILRRYKDLSCNVVFVAQEKDHNPPKGRDVGPTMIRPMQEGSFMGASLGGGTAGWLHDACGYLLQLYQDAETREVVTPIKIGNEIREEKQIFPTGRVVRRLRCVYSPNYAGGFRSPTPGAVPEYIEAEKPEEMFAEFMKVVSGEKTLKGKYR